MEWEGAMIKLDALLMELLSKDVIIVFESPGDGEKWPSSERLTWALKPGLRGRKGTDLTEIKEWTKADCDYGDRQYNVSIADWDTIADGFRSIQKHFNCGALRSKMNPQRWSQWQQIWVTLYGIDRVVVFIFMFDAQS